MFSKLIRQDNPTSQDHSKQIQLDPWKFQDLWSHSLGVSRLANVPVKATFPFLYQVEISYKSLQSKYGPGLALHSWHSSPAMPGSQRKTWPLLRRQGSMNQWLYSTLETHRMEPLPLQKVSLAMLEVRVLMTDKMQLVEKSIHSSKCEVLQRTWGGLEPSTYHRLSISSIWILYGIHLS